MESQKYIENRIFTIRNYSVMLDRDLAELYQVEVKRLNEQVKRNIERFPDSFRFQLTDIEKEQLVANCDRFNSLKHSTTNPYAFTEQGVAMLSAVLRSGIAIRVSIQIINTFVALRTLLEGHPLIDARINNLEKKQLETELNFEKVFKALQTKPHLEEGIFYDGQIFDSWSFVSDLIKSATQSIILIDNYVDDTVLTLLSKRNKGVKASIYTRKPSKQLMLDVQKCNAQYEPIEVIEFSKSHDRFLILDQKSIYHIGASLKDLGKKWFAFSKLNIEVKFILNELQNTAL